MALGPVPRVFVYGTLMRGHRRAARWPRAARRVETAAVLGRLYDLGPYPALVAGDHWVAGELWEFDADQIASVLETLDQVEHFAGRPGDLYRRKLVTCRRTDETWATAHAYFYHQPLHHAEPIPPDPDGYCRWKKTVEEEG